MSIEFYRMSLQGTSHVKAAIPCQDANEVIKTNNNWIVSAIADGLGSASHADVGAKLAVKTITEFIIKYISNDASFKIIWDNDTLKAIIRLGFSETLRKISYKAKLDNNQIGDYDTTLSVLIYNGVNLVYGHCGDGGIIALSNYGDFLLLTEAQKGEEFNQVYSLRSQKWFFGNSNESICSILMMTDGIYDNACPPMLKKEVQPIYIDYIRRFMDNNVLKLKESKDFLEFQKKVIDLFNQDNSISDDKTIVGIINTNIIPEIIKYPTPDFNAIKLRQNKIIYGSNENQPEISINKTLEKVQINAPHEKIKFESIELFSEKNNSIKNKFFIFLKYNFLILTKVATIFFIFIKNNFPTIIKILMLFIFITIIGETILMSIVLLVFKLKGII